MKKFSLVFAFLLLATNAMGQNLGDPLIIQPQFNNASGLPLALGKLCSYDAGTTNLRATFLNRDLTTNNDNPMILGAGGFPQQPIYLDSRAYKFVLRTAGTDNTCSTGTIIATADYQYSLAALFRSNFATKLDDLVCHPSQYTGTTPNDLGGKWAACLAILASTGGTIDLSGLEGSQTVTSNAFNGVSKPSTTLMPAGTISFTVAQTIPGGTTIIGRGGQTILTAGNGKKIFSVSGTNVKFSDLAVTLTDSGLTSRFVQFDGASTNVYIDNVVVTGNLGSTFAITLGGSAILSIPVSNLYVTNSVFNGLGYVIIKDNADISDTTNTVFSNVKIYNTIAGINVNHPLASVPGKVLGSWTQTQISNVTCDTSANNGWCIGLSGAGVLQTQMSNFNAINCAQECIHIEDGARIISFNGGSIIKKGTSVAGHGLIQILTGASDISITGYDFNMTHPSDGSDGYGIYVTSGGSGVFSKNLVFANNTFATKSGNIPIAMGDSLGVNRISNLYRNPDTASKAAYFVDISGSTVNPVDEQFENPAVLYAVNAGTLGTISGIRINGELTGFDFLTGKPSVYDSTLITSFTIYRSMVADASVTNNILFPAGTLFQGQLGIKFVPSSGTVQYIVTGMVDYDGTTLRNVWGVDSSGVAPGDLTGFYRTEHTIAAGGVPGAFAKTGANITVANSGTASGNAVITFNGQYFR